MNLFPLSFVELSKNNLVFNLRQFRRLAKRGTKFAIVVKGNAYGHGQNEIVKIAEPHADYFQVDGIEELEKLRKVSRKKVLLLGYVQKNDLRKAARLGCILSVFSMEQVDTIGAMAEITGRAQEKHINIYRKTVALAEQYGFKDLQTHISSTAGLLAYEKKKGIHPIVRLGIGTYGMWPSEALKKRYKNKMTLKPVLAWKTKIAQVKTLPKGSTVGYGLTYKTKKATRVA